jgi:hypothetical protein
MSFLKNLKDTFTVEGSGRWADAPIVVDETINMQILSARTVTNEAVAQYGWSDADVPFLKDFGPICVVMATHGEPPYPIRSMDKEAFVSASTRYLAQRRRELGLRAA